MPFLAARYCMNFTMFITFSHHTRQKYYFKYYSRNCNATKLESLTRHSCSKYCVWWKYTQMQRLPDDLLYTRNYCSITFVNTQSCNHALCWQNLLTFIQPFTVLNDTQPQSLVPALCHPSKTFSCSNTQEFLFLFWSQSPVLAIFQCITQKCD